MFAPKEEKSYFLTDVEVQKFMLKVPDGSVLGKGDLSGLLN